jgi:Uma2 family endonuclease
MDDSSRCAATSWGLEYVFLFGLPENKLEFFGGGTPCVFPFLERETADAHLERWIETIRRWKRVSTRPLVEDHGDRRRVEVAGFEVDRHRGPIHWRIPFDFHAFLKIHRSYWRSGVWGEQPSGQLFGMAGHQTHADVALNLWKLFGAFCDEYGGVHSGRVDIALSDTASATPDQYYFREGRDECMIERDYFRGIPALIAEVLEPSTRALDRGPRKDLYLRSGVKHLWLLEPAAETVETYERTDGRYELTAVHRAGESFRCGLFPGIAVSVDELFDTQWKDPADRWSSAGTAGEGAGGASQEPAESDEDEDRDQEVRAAPGWLLPPDLRVGLEYLLVMGHPDRRHEIRDNRATCVLAFESDQEARLRFRHFLEDICLWESPPVPPEGAASPPFSMPKPVSPDLELAEAGRFRLTRRGRYVDLEVAVDGRKYRELLGAWARPEAWDWVEERE